MLAPHSVTFIIVLIVTKTTVRCYVTGRAVGGDDPKLNVDELDRPTGNRCAECCSNNACRSTRASWTIGRIVFIGSSLATRVAFSSRTRP